MGGILGYCRELGVALELFVNDNRAALISVRLSILAAKPSNGRGDLHADNERRNNRGAGSQERAGRYVAVRVAAAGLRQPQG